MKNLGCVITIWISGELQHLEKMPIDTATAVLQCP